MADENVRIHLGKVYESRYPRATKLLRGKKSYERSDIVLFLIESICRKYPELLEADGLRLDLIRYAIDKNISLEDCLNELAYGDNYVRVSSHCEMKEDTEVPSGVSNAALNKPQNPKPQPSRVENKTAGTSNVVKNVLDAFDKF